MKTKLLAGLVASCFAAPVLAQSNITIYGIMDAGIHVSSNGEGTKTKLVSGIADGSRLGFKGTEDLGGGYKAIFNIESRIELDNGTNQAGNISDNQGFALTKGMDALGPTLLPKVRAAMQPAINVNTNKALFDRTAMVGLITPVGAVLAGRMYTPAYEVLAGADTFETGTAGSWGSVALGSGGILTAGTAIRSDKALQYRIELPNGISAALMYGFKNSGYIGLDDKFWGANVMYKANGFNLGLGHNHGTDQNGNSGLVTTVLGGSYQTGAMKFFAGYQAMKNDNSVLIPVVRDQVAQGLVGLPQAQITGIMSILNTNLERNFKLDANSLTVGMHYAVGNGRVMGSVSYQNDKTAFNNDATQYALGYDYNLSKRTDIYTVLAYIKNDNDAQYAPGAASAPGGFTSAEGVSGKAIQIGMRHRF